MIAPRRCRRRGWSLVDVAVAFTLLAFVFVGAARFVITLAQSSEVSVTRAAARREIRLAEELLAADFSQLSSCGPGVAATRFGGFGVPGSGGTESISVYVDVDLDGDADLVGWRVHGSTLQRAVQRNNGVPCDTLDLDGATWKQVLDPVEAVSDTSSYFSIIRDGYPAAIAGDCTDAGMDCRADAVRVALATRVGDSGPVRLDEVHPVPATGL